MSTSSNNWLRIVADCISELSDNKVNIKFSNTDSILLESENVNVNGYWDDANENNLIFACAVGKPVEQWGPIFVHEFCHFQQWKEKEPLWHAYQTITKEENYNILHNKPISNERLHFCLDIMRDVELDCEKKTVALLKKYKVPIDIEQYIKGANTYIHFYNHIKQYRQWYPLKYIPYVMKRLLKIAAPTFYKDYTEIPPELIPVYEQYYPPKKKNNLL